MLVILCISTALLAASALGIPLLLREFNMTWRWRSVPARIIKASAIPRKIGFYLDVEYDLEDPQIKDYTKGFGPEWNRWYPSQKSTEFFAEKLPVLSLVAYLDEKGMKAYLSRPYDLTDKLFAPFALVVATIIFLSSLLAFVVSTLCLARILH